MKDEPKDFLKAAGIGAGVGLGAFFLLRGSEKIQKLAVANMEKIHAFEQELEHLIQAATLEGQISSFALPIEVGHPFLNALTALRLQDSSRKHRRDIRDGLSPFDVTLATARPMADHPALLVRKMTRGYLGKGLKFDIVGEDNLYAFEPRRYRPNEKPTG